MILDVKKFKNIINSFIYNINKRNNLYIFNNFKKNKGKRTKKIIKNIKIIAKRKTMTKLLKIILQMII